MDQYTYNPLLSLLKNPAFYPLWNFPATFSAWPSSGKIRFQNFVTSSTFSTFLTPLGYPNQNCSNTSKLKAFTHPTLTLILSSINFLALNPHASRLISSLYSHLVAKPDSGRPQYTLKWEKDLGHSLDIADLVNKQIVLTQYISGGSY